VNEIIDTIVVNYAVGKEQNSLPFLFANRLSAINYNNSYD